MVRSLMLILLCCFLGSPEPAFSQGTKKCVGLKQYYAGKCRYPDEVKKLKAKKRKKRGSLGGRCFQNKTCNEGLICNAKKRCEKPPTGTLGGECYGNKTCNAGLRCGKTMLCETIPQGVLNGPCYGNGTCDEGFVCANKVCIKSEPKMAPPAEEAVKPNAEQGERASVTRSTRLIPRQEVNRPSRVKFRELPGLRRLGLVMVDAHPGWQLTLERPDMIELRNKRIGVVFTVTTQIQSGTFSLWKGRIRSELQSRGTNIRSARLMRLDGAQGVLMTGYAPDPRRKVSLGYSEHLTKVGDVLMRLQWVSHKKMGKADAAFVAALKSARLIPPLRPAR